MGKGAMGEVHLAKHLSLRRKVAYKFMVSEAAKSKELTGRFFSEAQITAQLEHPNIVPVYGLEVRSDGTLAYAMKLVQGKELADVIEETRAFFDRGEPLDEDHQLTARLEHFIKTCDAMAFAHAKGVVHRDLKPANIMIGRYNELYVMDWGIAHVMNRPESPLEEIPDIGGTEEQVDVETRTRMGAVIGTPRYLSSEQAAGKNNELDGRSDLYTLGLILQELVTLKAAVEASSVVAMLHRAMNGEREPVHHYSSDEPVPLELAAIISKATACEREERYRTVTELADDVRRFVHGEETSVLPDRGFRRLTRWIGHNQMKALAVMMTMATIAVGAGGVIGTLSYEQSAIQRAHEHEKRVTTFLQRIAIQAHRIDNELHEYVALLEGLSGAATELLIHSGPSGAPAYFNEDFVNGRRTPPDAAHSEFYERDVSVEYPVIKLAPGIERDSVMDDVSQLGWLRLLLKRMLLLSHREDAYNVPDEEARRIILAGTPIRSAFIALENGLLLAYPGMAAYEETYDGRQQSFYSVAANKKGLYWGDPYEDLNDLTLPCSTALFDGENEFIGVAGIEVSFDYIIGHLMDLVDASSAEETMLVTPDGTVMVHSIHEGREADVLRLHANEPIDLSLLPFPEVVAAIQRGEYGYIEIEKERPLLVGYFPIDSLDWYYVVVAEEEELLDLLKQDGPAAQSRTVNNFD